MMQVRREQEGEAERIAKAMRSVGLSCTAEYLNRTFQRHGVVVEDEAGCVVGYCGLIPAQVWVGERTLPAIQLGMLGLLAKGASALPELIDGVRQAIGSTFCYANTANAKGSMIWTRYAGFTAGPRGCGEIHYAVCDLVGLCCAALSRRGHWMRWLATGVYWLVAPLRWLERGVAWAQLGFRNPCLGTDFSLPRWRGFLVALRRQMKGVMTAREIDDLAVRFGEHSVIVWGSEQVLGYIVIRRRYFSGGVIPRYDIVDLCALGNDDLVLTNLLRQGCRFVRAQGGAVLEYVGAPIGHEATIARVLSRVRPAPSNSFVYLNAEGTVGRESLASLDGWFFGPYDGDRCIS